MDLDGKIAIVTGGTDGIGRAICELFAAHGARQVVVARRAEPGAALAEELGSDRIAFLAADIAHAETAPRAVALAQERFGGLDVLVNNAALDHAEPLLEADLEPVAYLIEVNVIGTLRMLQAAGRAMRDRGRGGSIVNLSSRLGSIGVPTMGIYGATKGAVNALTRHAAIELAPHGIRVNAVAPGITDTPLIAAWLGSLPDPAGHRTKVTAAIPQQRFATPRDIAEAVLHLASDRSAHTTGVVLPVDGGYTAA